MSLWTAQQHEWLQALGHPVLLLAGDPSLEAARVREGKLAAASSGRADAPAEAAPARRRSVGGPRQEAPATAGDNTARNPAEAARPSHSMAPISAPDAPAHGPVAGAARTDTAEKKAALEAARGARRAARPPLLPSDDPLLLSILRASGMEAAVFEVAAQAWRIDLIRLRAEPSAKRVLWQQMRKARRNRNG